MWLLSTQRRLTSSPNVCCVVKKKWERQQIYRFFQLLKPTDTGKVNLERTVFLTESLVLFLLPYIIRKEIINNPGSITPRLSINGLPWDCSHPTKSSDKQCVMDWFSISLAKLELCFWIPFSADLWDSVGLRRHFVPDWESGSRAVASLIFYAWKVGGGSKRYWNSGVLLLLFRLTCWPGAPAGPLRDPPARSASPTPGPEACLATFQGASFSFIQLVFACSASHLSSFPSCLRTSCASARHRNNSMSLFRPLNQLPQ